MNKILVFTNNYSWQCISETVTDLVDWDDSYPNNAAPLTLCTTNRTLQSVDNISAEGVYLVYDAIDAKRLRLILNQCPDDVFFILIHRHPAPSVFCDWNKQSVIISGMHDNDDKNKYYPLFKILTDDKPDKTNRIIKSVFIDAVESNFISGCSYPHNNSNQFRLAYRILREQPDLKDAVEEFMSVYEQSDDWSAYREHLNKLKHRISDELL